MCCRDHDNCGLFVEAGITKYRVTNDGLYTISACKCDAELRACLDKLNFWVANLVTKLYGFTNQKCLVNMCEIPYVRCPRGEILSTLVSSNVFEGVEMSNDTNALNQLIRDGMKTDQKIKEGNENQRLHHNHPFHPVRSLFYQQPYPSYYPWTLQPIDYLAAPQSENFLYHNLPNTPMLQSDIVCCVDELQQL